MMVSLLDVLVVFLSFTFLFSAIPKLIHLSSFVELVKDYGVLPTMISGAVAVLIPFGELTGATLLLFPETLQAGSLILLVLLLSFLYAVSQVIRRNKILTCGCYGKFLDAKADRYTWVKIIIMMSFPVLLLIYGNRVPFQFHIESIGAGILMVVFMLLLQKAWTVHQDTVQRLKNVS